VWWVILVEATVMRTSQPAYDQALANLGPAERRVIEGIFTGLRFVRNWLGYHADPADFILPWPASRSAAPSPARPLFSTTSP
jgi:hypothetical protein